MLVLNVPTMMNFIARLNRVDALVRAYIRELEQRGATPPPSLYHTLFDLGMEVARREAIFSAPQVRDW